MMTNIRALVLGLPRPVKRSIVILVDVGLMAVAVWLAFYLRIGVFVSFWALDTEFSFLRAWGVSIVVGVTVFRIFGLYLNVFRYSGGPAILAVGKAVAVYGVIYATILIFYGLDGVPRTIGIIQPILLFILVMMSRFIASFWLGGLYREHLRQKRLPKALIYGAGTAGRELAAALTNSADAKIAGFLDDDALLHDTQISGLPVYNPAKITVVAKQNNIAEVMLALPKIGRRRRNEILRALSGHNFTVRTVPSYSDLAKGRVTISDVLDLSVDDVLGRDTVPPDEDLMARDIRGKTVLVTGAGGSIGSVLCHHIYANAPKRLVLLDHSEFALYSIHEAFRGKVDRDASTVEITAILCSVNDSGRLAQVFTDLKPDTVFHAAAYKHVHLVEENKFEGIQNNVFGTLNVAMAAIDAGAGKFVLVSTDKAVRPTNIMGASKRLAEMTLQALSTTQSQTIFAMVRFGNVLDSSGSVVPLFRQQIKSGGPVTVTHPEVTRYFMTISEAAQLVIQAGAMTKMPPIASHAAPVYLLDMGEPVKILDLARRMIELSGLTVYDLVSGDGDLEIKITGLRSGEKLYEELLIGDAVSQSDHPKIKFADEAFLPWPQMQKELQGLHSAVKKADEPAIIKKLCELVTGFQAASDK
ncbi:polysaccharide biosynthesis protein [Alphaproteobacteria bacterium]|nr:polysaccharide biosynthesis protein [Alphaproteobacteria bacterium]